MADQSLRRLSAIMFADMVGYTALMQEDEGLARARRDRYREVLTACVRAHRGVIRQHYGDGALSTFDSAVEAVQCAIELQRQLRVEPVVPVRIGVHTGDIIHDDEGVYGDGVNLAARIEALADPGGVMVSGKVFDEIKNHASISTLSYGEVQLKNVGGLTAVFAISNEGLVVAEEARVRTRAGEVARSRVGDGRVGSPASEPPWGAGEAFIRAVRERALIQWAMVYLAGAWVLLETLEFTGQILNWPTSMNRGFDVMAFVGFLVAMVVTWFHGEKGRQRVQGWEVLIITVILAAGGAALTVIEPGAETASFSTVGRPGTGSGSGAPREGTPAIAVLPFENFSPNPNDAYFAFGVQEDITTALAQVRGIRVPGRSSVDRFRDQRPPAREIAAMLGVDYLLEGSARVAGGQVRVTVQLIDGRTDAHLWSDVYDRDFTMEDLIAVQSDVAQEVATRLRTLVTPEESERIAAPRTSVPAAFENYQRARYIWNNRTQPDVRAAIDLLQQAIVLDSTFAEAHAGLADAYLVMANWGWMDHRVAFSRAVDAAESALALDPLLASAHASLGALHLWATQEWASAEQHFRTAIELDPANTYGHMWYSSLLSALDRHDEAIREADQAKALDPLSPVVDYRRARALFFAGDLDRTIETSLGALEENSGDRNLLSLLCIAYIVRGSLDLADDSCERHQALTEDSFYLNVGILQASAGDREGALAEIEQANRARGALGSQPVIEAMVYAALPDVDAAIETLNRAVDGGYPHLEYLSNHPFFEPLESDPRFLALRRRLDFPQFQQ